MSDREERKHKYVEWRRDHGNAWVGDVDAADEYDAFDPPPAPPLPRCQTCGGETRFAFTSPTHRHVRCVGSFSHANGPTAPTDAEAIRLYERPVRLAEAWGRVQAADVMWNEEGAALTRIRDRYRAELTRLESEGGPT